MIFNSGAAGKNRNARRRAPLWIGAALLACQSATAAPPSASQPLDPTAAAQFAALALSCLHREYPNKASHVMASDADALPPHVLTPAFYGCFDWHSDVHGHWLLVRLARLYPTATFALQARAELARSLTPQNIAGEAAFLKRDDQTAFERPYGLAWLLTLSAELRQWNDPQAKQWLSALLPLETEAVSHLKSWLPKLHYPIRIGEHDQTAFSFGLVWDWAGVAGDTEMLEGIAHGLGRDDRRSSALLAAANSHRHAALPEVTGEHYEGGHWLGTFAVYLTSHAGL